MIEIFLYNSIEIIKYFIIFSFLFQGKFYKDKRQWFRIGICLIGFIIEIYLIQRKVSFVSVFYILFIVLLLYDGKMKNKIILYVLSLIGVNYIDTAMFVTLGYLIKGKIWWYYIYDAGWIKIYANIISFIIVILIVLGCRRFVRKNMLNRKIETLQCSLLSVAMLSLYFIFIIMMMTMAYGKPENRARLYNIIGLTFAIIVACIIVFFLHSNRLKHQNDVHIETEGLYGESLGLKLAYGEQVHDDYEKVRQFRHDFRHHIAAMEGLVYGGEYSELEKYMGQLSQKDKELNQERIRYTGNFMVDSIIFGITREQKFEKVDFQFNGGLPSNLGVKDIDICGVLANALENAMEACLKGNDRKAVIMKAGCYENMISFQIKNTYDSSRYKALAGGEFYSSKEGDGHGYGIQNMERVVKSYNGRMEYNVDPEWVTVNIFLQQKDEI